MASEAARVENSDSGGRKGLGTWLREHTPFGRPGESVTERAVEEAVQDPELESPYPRYVSDAVVSSLDGGLPIGEDPTFGEPHAVGFSCERRPTMILIARPMVSGLTTYRIEVQEPTGRYREMELTVIGKGTGRRLMEADVWFEQHIPGQEQAVSLGAPETMESAGLLKLSADLEGRVRDGTSVEVEPTKDHRADSHRVAPRLSASESQPEPRLER